MNARTLLVAGLIWAFTGPLIGQTRISLPERRAAAEQQAKAGNWKDALAAFRLVLHDRGIGDKDTARDLDTAVSCLFSLNQHVQIDELVEGTVAAHPQDWRVLTKAALIYLRSPHFGIIIEEKFQRAPRNSSGRRVDATARDRVRALQLLEQAAALSAADPDKAGAVPERSELYRGLANLLASGEGWRLQALTDLTKLPDYDEQQGYRRGRGWSGSDDRGAPVNEKGDPVFHAAPEAWAAAKSDGERWRHALAEWRALGPEPQMESDFTFAQWLAQEFDVHSLAMWGFGGDGADDSKDAAFAVHTLADNETIARLATGAKRFTLPAEFDFHAIFARLTDQKDVSGGWAAKACHALADSHLNRRQRDTAATWLRKALAISDTDAAARHKLDQIVKNWGRFDASLVQTPGKGASVGFSFRNATLAKFTARKVDFKKLLADVKAVISAKPQRLSDERINVQSVGQQILRDAFKQYIGERVASWELKLEPRERHWDKRIDVTTPLQTPGAYLLESSVEGGNTCGIVVWITDTVIVQKPGASEVQYYVADSVTGVPVPKANVECFGYRQQYIRERQGKDEWRIDVRRFAEFADAQGQLFTKETNREYQWLLTATTPEGRFAHLGFSSVWFHDREQDFFDQTKIYVITDRPVYRPEQPVKFKAWVRRARYDAPPDRTEFASQKFTVEIKNPKGEKIHEAQFTTDAYGGLSGEWTPGGDATLGSYTFHIWRQKNEHLEQRGNFRVEEYKKPEFEVKVNAPTDPIALGEKVKAKVEAKYYFGAPVVNARVKYKVERSAHTERWYPVRPWDWFYGRGYWWFSYDYDWYPGWRRWGCFAPVWWWYQHSPDPPELVLENEVPIGPDGTLEIEIDTAMAKTLHGDEDHRYSITVEVTDESRRTILGSGAVLVAREPFKVNVWTDRGHYEAGEPINAGIRALTLDSKGVTGSGRLALLKLKYDPNGQPQESEVLAQDIKTNADGAADVKLTASEPGQYRLKATITDAKGRAQEGGYVFIVRGAGFDGRDFRFSQLELIPDKPEYAPGEDIKLSINTDRADSTVFLFIRSRGQSAPRPRVLVLKGKSALESVKVETGDMPNFFVEAFTVSAGKVHTAVREIAVPPAKRVLNMEVLSSAEKFKPRDKAKLKIKLTDLDGKPFTGSTVLTVYDKALEYISGGSNVPDIKEFFWKWRRWFHQSIAHSLSMYLPGLNVPFDARGMEMLGVFGEIGDESGWGPGSGGGFGRGRGMGQQLYRRSRSIVTATLDDGIDGLASLRSAAPAAAAPMDGRIAEDKSAAAFGGAPPSDVPAQPVMIRTDFADSIHWTAAVETNAEGLAEIEVPLPDNLTTWKIKAWAMGQGTRVGEGETEIITSKDLIIRQQAPRFFVEKDEVVLSANVHNYLPAKKDVTVSLELEGSALEAMPGIAAAQKISLESGKEQRVDWRVKAVREGTAVVRMKAITDSDSDAMQMSYPVLVHGMLKTESWSASIRPEGSSAKIEFTVPNERRPDQSRLEIRYSPTIATAILDAIPYLADYPYGCTEQTLNRFLPMALAAKTLEDSGINLKDIRSKVTNLNPQEIGDDKERAKQWKRLERHPVFNERAFTRMVKTGLEKLTAMQNGDGGWGWFSGHGEQSWPHTTSVVVHGLTAAKGAGLALVPGVLENGIAWLKRHEAAEVQRIQDWAKNPRPNSAKEKADEMDAFIHFVLSEGGVENAAMRDFLYRDRNDLEVYAKVVFALALEKHGQKEKLAMLSDNIRQFLVTDDENQTARLDVKNGNFWWWWYGSDIEANAFYLKLLSRLDPQGATAAGVVKYLINNRKNATWWNSTRDTAYCVEAMNDFLRASKEAEPDVTVEVLLDGAVQKTVRITKDNLFNYDNALLLTGDAVKNGNHTVEIRKTGRSPVYANAYLTNFTLEDRIARAGLEVKIDRRYWKLVEKKDAAVLVSSTGGQAIAQRALKFERQPIADGASLKSGDLVEVELLMESKNDYEYLLFEDMKPAGFEADDVRSGYVWTAGLSAYREFHDDNVALFVRQLPLGRHSLTYRLRAEIPGKFSALPAKASAMYTPELRGNSDEMKLGVED